MVRVGGSGVEQVVDGGAWGGAAVADGEHVAEVIQVRAEGTGPS